MPSARLTLREEDVVRLALEFLHNRELHISQLSLERETGVINGNYSDDVLFLRQLILDGQWDDVLEFIQPLEALPTFDMRKFTYAILKHKYIELLCIKSEANVQGNNVDNAVEEVVKVLNDLEKYAPTKEDYSTLCLLLTLPRLTDHLQYKDWNPSNARVLCFREIYPLVADFLPGDRKTTDVNANTSAKNDRLIQLVIKGILYESCVNYCQAKATGTTDSQNQEMNFSRLLDGSVGFSDSDLSLLSWLQSVPHETFSVPFEQRTLNVDVERLEKPSLETSWAEHMLITPIKPKTFPHSAMPFTRPKSAADIMSRSLMPVLDGMPYGLNSNIATHNGNPRAMAMSTGDIAANPMTRSSFASFHLTGIKNSKLMNSSVDRLFENEGEVFLSNSYAEFQQLPSIQEQGSTPVSKSRNRSRSPDQRASNVSTPEHRGRESPASTTRSSRRDSLNEKHNAAVALHAGLNINHQNVGPVQAATAQIVNESPFEANYQGDLLKEFQKQKQKLQDTLNAREKEREELLRAINSNGNEYSENCKPGAKQINGTNGSFNQSKQQVNGNGDAYGRFSKSFSKWKSRKYYQDSIGPTSNYSKYLRKPHVQGDMKVLQEGVYDAVKFMGTAINHAAAMRRLESLFNDAKLETKLPSPPREVHVEIEKSSDANCDVHGRNARNGRRGSVEINGLRKNSANGSHQSLYRKDSGGWNNGQKRDLVFNGMGPRRDSMPVISNYLTYYNRRDSLNLPQQPPKKEMEHPSQFSSTLRKDDLSTSTGSLARKDINGNRWHHRRDSLGSTNSLKRDYLNVPTLRRNSRNFSTDSLDCRRNSWDPGRRGSTSSNCCKEYVREIIKRKPAPRRTSEQTTADENGVNRPRFVPITTLEDVQAVRCAEFHPSGQLYAVGSNSKTLRICAYPKIGDLGEDHEPYQPTVLFKITKHHKGSIYCLAWSPVGDLMATGSNDKTVKLMRFNGDTSKLEGDEIELSMHDGTIRDLCFLEDTSNKSSLLISGGAGDCKIYVTDCATGTPFQALSGHTGHILSLYTWGGAMFVSGSHDKTVRFWDLRTRGCVNMVTPVTVPGTRQGSPVASLCVDPSGRLLVSGHEDSSCVLFDIRGGRNIQCFKPHSADIRSIRFSPSAYYLLTAGYDNKLVLTDLQGDLTLPLPSVVVAQHQDKVISSRWHPSEFSFLSTSADKTATLWALPPI